MKKALFFLGVLVVVGIIITTALKKGRVVKGAISAYVVSSSLINKSGNTVASRVHAPEGYNRLSSEEGSFEHYIENYTLKNVTAQVINYTGKPYIFQKGHVGVLDIPVPSNGLQQCADALIRIRSEYLWDANRKDEIGFKFTSGHYCSWLKYAQGYRPKINGNQVTFSKKMTSDHSKENFYKYLNLIYTYAGTYSLSKELNKVEGLSNVRVGDMLVYPGFPGHIMMIGDIVEKPTGERLFLFFQGNTPAQSVHIIKNVSARYNPWYDLEGKESLDTPIYTFDSFSLVRFK